MKHTNTLNVHEFHLNLINIEQIFLFTLKPLFLVLTEASKSMTLLSGNIQPQENKDVNRQNATLHALQIVLLMVCVSFSMGLCVDF